MGLVTGPHAHTPRTHSLWVAGPGRGPQVRAVGRGRAPHPERPTPRQEAPSPPRTPSCRSRSAQSQLTRSRAVGLLTGPGTHTPRTHSHWVPDARPKNGRSGVGERPTPDAAHPGKRHPPKAPSCRPRSARSQLARPRAVGLGTGPHAHPPYSHSQWLAGPGRTPQKRAVGRGRAPHPGRPTPRQ